MTAPLGYDDNAADRGPRFLRIPLFAKLLGANLLIACLAWGALFLSQRPNTDVRALVVLAVALVTGLAVNLALVTLALHPIRDMERTVHRVRLGDDDARVGRSPVGDPNLDKVGATLNALLDHLEDDRTRLRGVASEVMHAEDRERARLGRELHDAAAQSIAGVTEQLSVAEKEAHDPAMAERLRAIRVLAGQVQDEIDVLSHAVHPRVLNDLGLLPALRHLARTIADDKHAIEVRVVRGQERQFRGLGIETSSALYRVAQESVQNAIRHAHAHQIRIDVGAEHDAITLEVSDNGSGFDVAEAMRRRPRQGLDTMRDRVDRVLGEFRVTSTPGQGTTVFASIPMMQDAAQYKETAGV